MRSAACAGPKALFERSDVGEQLVGQRFALGAKLGRTAQYQYGASTPLCYGFKGGVSPTKAASHTRLGRSTVYSDIKRGGMPEPFTLDLEQILR